MRFEFATAARILFGEGTVREVVPAARAMGNRALLVTGRSLRHAEPLARELDSTVFQVEGEPTVDLVREGVRIARQAACEVVVSVGGGSAIDAGKAIAALLPNSGEPLDYLEVVGKRQPLVNPSAPFIAVPTTAGTGSEVTRNAVLASPEHRVKASLRSPSMLPALAVVDPELTYGLPREITASTGLDALTQLIEPYVSVRANAMTDMFCVEGVRRVARSLTRACEQDEPPARADMAMASLLGGLSLANSGLGAVHGFAAPIGGMFPAPHGTVCAALLPRVMDANIRALRAREPESEPLRRYAAIAAILTNRPDARPELAVEWVAELCERLGVPPLAAYGITEADFDALVAAARRASSMKGNPITLEDNELRAILSRAA